MTDSQTKQRNACLSEKAYPNWTRQNVDKDTAAYADENGQNWESYAVVGNTDSEAGFQGAFFLNSIPWLRTPFLIVLFGCLLGGCGEKYSEQGDLLFQKLHEHLISRGICSTPQDCYEKFEIAGGHGNQVNFSIYNQKDRKALAALIEFIIENGLQITGGVPISVSVYPKPRDEYGNFLFNPEPMVKVEVTK